MSHLSPEALIDWAEQPEAAAAGHLAACPECRAAVADLRALLREVEEATEVPEPSPLFWDHLSARVREAVAEEPPPATWWSAITSWRAVSAAGLAALVLAVAVSSLTGPASEPLQSGRLAPGPIVANPADDTMAFADDPSLGLLSDLAEQIDWSGQDASAPVTDGVVDELSAGERNELQRLLREAIDGTGAPSGA